MCEPKRSFAGLFIIYRLFYTLLTGHQNLASVGLNLTNIKFNSEIILGLNWQEKVKNHNIGKDVESENGKPHYGTELFLLVAYSLLFPYFDILLAGVLRSFRIVWFMGRLSLGLG